MDDLSYGFGIVNNKMSNMSQTSSSDGEPIRHDMSYLYGRDPSILAYGQRPFPSQDSKKNLYSLLEEEQDVKESTVSRETISTVSTSTTDLPDNQTIKVFLRMKPLPKKMKLTQEQMEAYSIINSTTLMTKMPSLDSNTSCLKKIKPNETVCRSFIFTQTFDADTSQLELFENAVKPQMVDFLAGKNSVVMSYGTTNSGKTYTLQGTPESPGLIPRGIEFVFSNISPRGSPCFKPVNLCDVIYLSSLERSQEADFKMKLLALNAQDKNCYVNTYNQMQQLLLQESPMRPNRNNDAQYSVWISFAEIYNETIYDLLWNDCQKKRPALKLATDSRGRTFIKGLRSICVSSGAEAYQVLMAGQYNLKVAATALNSRSSRSHCIFTIKLLKYRNEHSSNAVDVSIFAFCDLAGSERLKKTLNVGERLKEAQNINTSLLVLGRCLKNIYESQSSKQKNESIGPFRESKLTRLFQRALSGKEQIALIVNVNPVPNLYIETQNVLNFSAIAKKIVVQHNVIKRRHSQSRFSRLVTQSVKTEEMDWENTELDDETELPVTQQESDFEENDQEAYEELVTENELLKKENKELKQSILTREMQTRQEMTEVYTEIMKKLEEDWKSRLLDMEEQQEDLRDIAVQQIELYYKDKLSRMSSRKRSRQSMTDDDSDDDKMYIEDLEDQNKKLTTKVETLKKMARDLKQNKEAVEAEKTKMSFELVMIKEEAKRAKEKLATAQEAICSTKDAPTEYINKLLDDINLKDERIKKMKTFLNEAKEEYITISTMAQEMETRNRDLDVLVAENIEQIRDLEEQLNQANAYSSEQNKVIEGLEEELEQNNKRLIEAEEQVQKLSEKLAIISSAAEKTKLESNEDDLLLDNFKSRLEFAENEKDQLEKKLNDKVKEIESLQNHLDETKCQLDKLTEEIADMNIEKPKHKKMFQTEQEVQTEQTEAASREELKVTNTSCQTMKLENEEIETDEKDQQTSMWLNETHDKEEIINEKNVIIEAHKEAYNELEKQFGELKEDLEICKAEKLEAERRFEKDLKELQTQMSDLTAQMEEKNEKISTMQIELNQMTEDMKGEEKSLKDLASAQEAKCKELYDKIVEAQRKEQDKETEIDSLQKEMKNLIKSNEETVLRMEGEIKSILMELTSAKDKLDKAEERYQKTDKDYRQVVHILEKKIGALEGSAMEKQIEVEKLKQKVEELKKALRESELELEVFSKNRDQTVSKYEDLVKSQYNELEQLKEENAKLQESLQEVKENKANPNIVKSARKPRGKAVKTTMVLEQNTSEDDHVIENSQSDKEKSKKALLTPKVDNISVVELSGSELKCGKGNAQDFAPPARVTRRKKLFTHLDESFVDIEQGDPSPSPNTKARSLRNRRK